MKKFIVISLLIVFGAYSANAARIKKSAAHSEWIKYEKVKPQQKLNNLPGFCNAETIVIHSQGDFDNIMTKITSQISEGTKKIKVVFEPQRYYFKERHIDFAKYNNSSLSIMFDGAGASFVGSSQRYKNGDTFADNFDFSEAYVDENLNPVSFWGKMHTTDRLLEVVDEKLKLCRIHYAGIKDYPEKECAQVYIFTSQSYRAKYFKVKYIKNEFIYFTADDLAPLNGDYNINFDYLVSHGNCFTRFKLCNIPQECKNYVKDGCIYLDPSIKYVQRCNQKTLFHFSKTDLSFVEVKNMNICGNRSTYKNHPQSLIYMNESNFHKGFYLHDCSFSSLKSQVLNASNTGNLQVSNNIHTCLYDQGYDIDNSCSNIYITNNHFSYCGLDLDIDGCIRCAGRSYYIGYNTFKNFGYSAIKLGNYMENTCVQGSRGVAEYNEIYYTDDYIQTKDEYTMMDAGAIYFYTQNEQAIVRYNKIYNYTGMYGNTGAYLDDGASNVILYGNVIVRILGDFKIYSRRAPVDENPKYSWNIKTSNSGNVILYNVVDGPCMFVAKSKDSGCYQGYNVRLVLSSSEQTASVIENFGELEEDIEIKVKDIAVRGRSLLSDEDRKQLRFIPTYTKLKM